MKKFFLLTIVLIVIYAATNWFVFTPASSDASLKSFTIKKGDGVNEISHYLKEQNFIRNKFIFETYVWLKGVQSKFQAGEHQLRQNMSLEEIIDALTSRQPKNEIDIKILEGWNNREIADYFEKEGVIDKEGFLKIIENHELEIMNYEFLADKPSEATLEGYLFPDTYRIYKEIPNEFLGSKDAKVALVEHIVKKMLSNFDRKLTIDLRQEIARQKKTIFEIVTMASILEREVMSEEDKAMVADLFWRRLKAGMPLQADSTINYITGKYMVRASALDLQIDSRYNTYKYPGLPVGPIGNPGLSAIKAAIYPKPNNYWYFLTTEDGKVIYSRNFEEHKANKIKYLK